MPTMATQSTNNASNPVSDDEESLTELDSTQFDNLTVAQETAERAQANSTADSTADSTGLWRSTKAQKKRKRTA